MPGIIAQPIIAGVFVELVEGGEVEDLADEVVEGFLFFDEQHAIVDELGGHVADDVNA